MIFLLQIPDWAPNIHPLLVHFPIAIAVVAFLLHLASFFMPEKWWDEKKTTLLYFLAAGASVITYYSGTVAADTVFLPSEAQGVLSEHADWALWTMIFLSLYAVLRLAFHKLDLFRKKAMRLVALITILPGLFLIYETAEYGGKMVFGYGVGTGQLVEVNNGTGGSSSEVTEDESQKSVLGTNDQGGWNLKAVLNGEEEFKNSFKWLEGNPDELDISVLQKDSGNQYRIQSEGGTYFLVIDKEIENIQADYYLNLSSFEGTVALVNHVQDDDNYDFVSLNTEGLIKQGRVNDGQVEVFGEEKYTAEDLLFVRTVVNGTHFRAYIDKEMAVHGHGDAPEAGMAGLMFEGNGSLLLNRIEVLKLEE